MKKAEYCAIGGVVWQLCIILPDKIHSFTAETTELHEEPHRPEIVGLVIVLRGLSCQSILNKEFVFQYKQISTQ